MISGSVVALLPLAAEAVQFALKMVSTLKSLHGEKGDALAKHLEDLEKRLEETAKAVQGYTPKDV